jgi:hypothetical protein
VGSRGSIDETGWALTVQGRARCERSERRGSAPLPAGNDEDTTSPSAADPGEEIRPSTPDRHGAQYGMYLVALFEREFSGRFHVRSEERSTEDIGGTVTN